MLVATVGNAILDNVLMVDRFQRGRKYVASRAECFAGGQAVNAALTMTGLGIEVDLTCRIGTDRNGQYMAETLASRGIHLRGSSIFDGARTMTATVIVEREFSDRTIIIDRDPQLLRRSIKVDEVVLSRADALYLAGHEIEAGVQAASLISRRGKPIFADIEAPAGGATALLPLLTELIAPAEVVRTLAGCGDLDVALARIVEVGPRVAVATLGAGGCVAWLKGMEKSITFSAEKIEAIDTTGAGDAFHGAFVASRTSGRPVEESLRFASRVAARKCLSIGPNLSSAQLESFKEELQRRDA